MSQHSRGAALQIYQLKITLRHVDPPIWRRVRLTSDTRAVRI